MLRGKVQLVTFHILLIWQFIVTVSDDDLTPQNCVKEFQDYHYITLILSLPVTKCIYGNLNAQELDQNCPEKRIVLTGNGGNNSPFLFLKLHSEVIPGDNTIFDRELVYDDDTFENNSEDKINIAEQLKLKSNCPHFTKPSQDIVFQVFHNDLNMTEYGLVCFVLGKLDSFPDFSELFCKVMVPYQSLDRSMVLNESQYEKYVQMVPDMKELESAFGCDVEKYWKEMCNKKA